MSSRLLLKPNAQLLAGTSAASRSQTWALAGAAPSLWRLQTPACCPERWRWAAATCPRGSADSTWSRRICRGGTGSVRETGNAITGILTVTERCGTAGTGLSICSCWRTGGDGGRKIDPCICGRRRWRRSLSLASAPHTVRFHTFIRQQMNRFLKRQSWASDVMSELIRPHDTSLICCCFWLN